MAKSWTVAEATQEINKGNKVAILDIGRRYPLFSNLVSRALSGDTAATLEILSTLPDYNTANKLNSKLKEGLEESVDEETEETEEAEETETTEKSSKEKESGSAKNYHEMTAKQMYEYGKGIGIKFASTKKDDMLAALDAHFKTGKKEEEVEVEEEEVEENEYEGKSAQELFKLAKSRKIKVEPKKPVKYYIQKLEEADTAESKDEEEDWGDEEEETKPAKATKSKPSKPAKDEDEDEDEWDI